MDITNDALEPVKKNLFSKIADIFRLNVVITGVLVMFLLFIIFGIIYLIIPKKPSNTAIVSPLQNINKKTIVEAKSNIVNKEIIGFLPSWVVSQNTEIYIKPLTQLIYFGFNINQDGSIVKYNDSNTLVLEWHYFNSPNFMRLKKEAGENKTKVLVAFKLFDNQTVDNLISNPVSTSHFIRNVIDLLKNYDLDGINLDIEYFTQDQDGAGFTDSDFPTSKFLNIFLEKVVSEFKKVDPNYIVSVDVNATVILDDKAYDMVKIGELADQIIVMAYDYRVPASLRAGPVAPISGLVNEHSITESINSLAGRVLLEKVILGIPLYGYEWQTTNKNHKSTAVTGSGALATYKRVQELLENRNDLRKYWDERSMSPWLVYEQSGAIKQIYYEDGRSLRAKVNFMKDNNLGGIALWALGYEGKYKEIFDIFE